MNTKYLLLILLVITGIYLFLGISSNKTDAMGIMGNSGMMGSGGGMMGGGSMMTGNMINSMGHGIFPQYKGIKTGPALFHYEGCIMCHTINGLGGGIMGPNLSHIGSIRSLSWIATQIADPSAHFKRNSVVTLNGLKYRVIMPSFKNMSSKNIGILAEYLESLK